MTQKVTKPLEPQRVVFTGIIHDVVQQKMQTDDVVQMFERVRRAPGTRCIVISPDGKLLLTKEYRFEHDKYDFRLPGGKVLNTLQELQEFTATGKSMTERAKESAIHELEEEAGIFVENIEFLCKTKCGATIEWDLYYFVIDKFAVKTEGQLLGKGEDIEVVWVPFSEVWEKCLDGSMSEDRSVAVLMRYLHKQGISG